MKIFCFACRGRMRRSLFLLLALFVVMGAGRLLFSGEPSGAGTALSALPKKVNVKTEEDRQSLLASLGWQTDGEPPQCSEVQIPKKFDDVYTLYNELQLTQGLDLTRWRGKTCTRYTYTVTNHPVQSENVHLNLLCRKGRLIGGDVCSLGLDGFQQNLLYPAAAQESGIVLPEET